MRVTIHSAVGVLGRSAVLGAVAGLAGGGLVAPFLPWGIVDDAPDRLALVTTSLLEIFLGAVVGTVTGTGAGLVAGVLGLVGAGAGWTGGGALLRGVAGGAETSRLLRLAGRIVLSAVAIGGASGGLLGLVLGASSLPTLPFAVVEAGIFGVAAGAVVAASAVLVLVLPRLPSRT